jgi:diadenosine tetraphosphate (Ap4A) HIT family hydrolase
VTEAPQQWVPRERWDALVRGEGCPLCAEVAGPGGDDAHGYFVADLTASRLRLASEQHVPGYCVLIARRHVREPYELEPAERHAFFEDLMRVGAALERAYGADKLNFSLLGNAVPHLHCHVQPRYYGDPYPGRPVDPGRVVQRVLLTPQEAAARVGAIRAALKVGSAP